MASAVVGLLGTVVLKEKISLSSIWARLSV